MDVVIATAALILSSPLLLLIAIVIRLDSPGPAFFRQTRIGRKQRPFEMWKFRTMYQNAPPDLHRDLATMLVRGAEPEPGEGSIPPVYKVRDDPRITRVGRWLRTTSLDELPIVTYEYEVSARWHFERFEMPQGITGLWQVSGRNRLNYRRRCELDIEYVRTWSLWLDLKILAKTLRAVVADREPLGRPRQRLRRRWPELGGT